MEDEERSQNERKNASRKIVAALLSGALLFCSFPPFEYFAFAWIALIPLISLCFSCKPGESFLYGLLAGIVFWLASIFWLTRVSFIGWVFISLYCSFYCALFALIISWWFELMCRNFNFSVCHSERSEACPSSARESRLDSMTLRRSFPPRADPPMEGTSFPPSPRSYGGQAGRMTGRFVRSSRLWPSDLMFLFGVPAIWVGFEYARAIFLTGFPWNILGVSQYSYGHLIQCAEWGGVYLVSYLVVMGNTAFALLIDNRNERNTRRWWASNKENLDSCRSLPRTLIRGGNDRRMTLWEGIVKAGAVLVSFLLILFLALEYGKWRLIQSPEKLETIRAAAVQSNVPQQYKWSEDWANDIYRRLKKATDEACKPAPPDLIVWPETALPDFVRYNGPSRELVDDARQHGVPLLVGSMDFEERPDKTNYFNSSFLFLPGRDEPRVYAKRHLVLFGEYVPFARFFPFLRSITGVEEDFMPGTENVVFRLNGVGQKFSVLICFEDTLPYLARECVRAGARLLINQTNDAWFDPLWASRQHMIHCVFRCVENRVACLRSTNTGVTCLIDRWGVIRSSLPPLGREQREPCSEAQCILQGEPQVMRSEVKFSPENMPLTFYTRHGDIFAVACAAFSLPLFLGALLSFLRKR